MTTHFTVFELKQRLLAGSVPTMVPLGAAAEMLGLTKSSLLRKAGTDSSRLKLMSITAAAGTVWNGVTADSLAEELDYQENHRPRTARLALQRLHALAKAGETSEYGEFMNDIGLSWRHPHHRALTGQLLGQISSAIYDRYKLLPSVLVVNKASQRPSEPFFQLARDLKAYAPQKQTEAVFFETMKAKVLASATRVAVWAWQDEFGE
jgi:hypothetical protein